jgi:hypothetical protein
MNSKNGNITYQFWIFLPRSETYAIRHSGPEVTGVYGPLDYREVLFDSLPGFPYEDQLDKVAWVKSNICHFVTCELEYEESMVWI